MYAALWRHLPGPALGQGRCSASCWRSSWSPSASLWVFPAISPLLPFTDVDRRAVTPTVHH